MESPLVFSRQKAAAAPVPDQRSWLPGLRTRASRCLAFSCDNPFAFGSDRSQAAKEPCEKPIPWTWACQPKRQAAGVPGDPGAHGHHTPHHHLHPARRCLLQPQRPGKNQVTAHHLEHVVHQHPQEKKGVVHNELPRREPLHVHLGLELGVVLLAGAPVPVELQNLILGKLQARPQYTDPDFGNQQMPALLSGHLSSRI